MSSQPRPAEIEVSAAPAVEVAAEHELGPDFEEAVARCVLAVPGFLPRHRPLLAEPGLFRSGAAAYLVASICRYFDEHKTCPDEAVAVDLLRRGDSRDRGAAVELARSAFNGHAPGGGEYVTQRLLGWARWTRITSVLATHDRRDAADFARQIAEAARTGEQLAAGELAISSESGLDFTELSRPGPRTPWDPINTLLRGGPELQDFCFVAAYINTGKTTALVNVAGQAVEDGELVCYATFEDGELDIRRRYAQYVTGYTQEQLAAWPKQAAETVRDHLERCGGKLYVRRFRNKRSTVDDFVAWVRSVEDREGRKCRLCVSDYMDRFAPPRGRKDPRHEYREVAEECKLAAVDLDAVHWSGTQGNLRAKGQEVVGLEFVGESQGKNEGAELILGLGQTEDDVQTGMMNMFTAKVRKARKHEVFRLRFEAACQRLYLPGGTPNPAGGRTW